VDVSQAGWQWSTRAAVQADIQAVALHPRRRTSAGAPCPPSAPADGVERQCVGHKPVVTGAGSSCGGEWLSARLTALCLQPVGPTGQVTEPALWAESPQQCFPGTNSRRHADVRWYDQMNRGTFREQFRQGQRPSRSVAQWRGSDADTTTASVSLALARCTLLSRRVQERCLLSAR
jgi:hypothetical protein